MLLAVSVPLLIARIAGLTSRLLCFLVNKKIVYII